MLTQEESTPKKPVLLYVFGLLVLVVLAAAAFMAAQMLNKGTPGGSTQFSGAPHMVISRSGSGGGDASSVELSFLPAPELPATQADANGVFVERKDNSLFIGTGNLSVSVGSDGGETSANSSYDGPIIEVVVTNKTIVYRDATQMGSETTSGTIQQVVEISDIEGVTSQSFLSVWGRKVGDRIIADVIMYMSPVMIQVPGG